MGNDPKDNRRTEPKYLFPRVVPVERERRNSALGVKATDFTGNTLTQTNGKWIVTCNPTKTKNHQ